MGYIYRGYRGLPFVFELRSLLDWMSFETSLDLWESLKLEDIYSAMFLVQCDVLYRKARKRGEVIPAYMKFFGGVLIFLLLLLIIFGPLLLFSSANPVTSSNNILSARVTLSAVGPKGEYPLLEISSMKSKSLITNDQYTYLRQYRLIGDDSRDNIEEISMVSFSDSLWGISPPSLTELTTSLLDPAQPMRFRLQYSFTRNGPPEQKTIDASIFEAMTTAQQNQMAAMITGTPGNYSNGFGWSVANNSAIVITGLAPQYLRLPATGTPLILADRYEPLSLQLVSGNNSLQQSAFWIVANGSISLNSNYTDLTGVSFVAVSNPIWTNPFGVGQFSYSIIGLYSVILITIARFVRFLFGNMVVNIPYEDLHDADDLMNFCEGIYIARYSGLFGKEERMYRRLVKIFRTPPLLTRLTRRKDD